MLTLHTFLSLAKISLMTDMLMIYFPNPFFFLSFFESCLQHRCGHSYLCPSFGSSSSFIWSSNIKDRFTPVTVAWWGMPLDHAWHPMPNDDRKTWHHPQLPWRDFPTDNASLTSPASKDSSKAAKPSRQTDFTAMPVCVSPLQGDDMEIAVLVTMVHVWGEQRPRRDLQLKQNYHYLCKAAFYPQDSVRFILFISLYHIMFSCL